MKTSTLQVVMDKHLIEKVEPILDDVGLNAEVLITSLYKRIAADRAIPFSFDLSEKEAADLALSRAIELVPTVHVGGMAELEDWVGR